MSPRESTKPDPTGDPQSFEQAMQRLESLVTELEAGDVPLEKSLQAFEEGQKLIRFCETKLQAAEKALKQLSKEADDALGDREPTPPPSHS